MIGELVRSTANPVAGALGNAVAPLVANALVPSTPDLPRLTQFFAARHELSVRRTNRPHWVWLGCAVVAGGVAGYVLFHKKPKAKPLRVVKTR